MIVAKYQFHFKVVIKYPHRNNIHSKSVKLWQSNPIPDLDKPLGFQEFEVPRISRQSAHEGGKVVSPTHRPRLAPRKYSWYSFLLEAELTPGP
jgi:hypothetical protein